ncbi:MAG: ribosome-associated translation inhibitor RaiA [Deltaproteobacteria bacterium]|nr:ribosome-associated translation inhibitor RaiA [Deltaproteobacteria bacterium]
MQVSVTFRHMEAAEAVKEYAMTKMARFKKYLYHPAEASIVLTREKHRIMAEITLTSQRFSFKGQEETEDAYSAIDLVVDKVERQLVKRKEKMKRRKSNSGGGTIVEAKTESPEPPEEVDGPRIVETRNFSVKPMSLEEAAQQMKLAKEGVFVFTNSSSGEVNVLYETKEGSHGLIVPGKE